MSLGILLSLGLDLLDPFLDLGDPDRDFLLFALQFLQGDDFVTHLGKVDRLRTAFASERDFSFLQDTLLMTQSHTRFLAPNLESELTKSCPNETHERTLPRLCLRQIKICAWTLPSGRQDVWLLLFLPREKEEQRDQ